MSDRYAILAIIISLVIVAVGIVIASTASVTAGDCVTINTAPSRQVLVLRVIGSDGTEATCEMLDDGKCLIQTGCATVKVQWEERP